MGLLTGAMKGLAEGGEAYAGRVLDERMEARRAERLASIKREDRAYKEGRDKQRRTEEMQDYALKRSFNLQDKEAAEKRRQEQLKEERAYQEGQEKYTSPEGYIYKGGKPYMVKPSAEQAEAEVERGGLLGDAFLPGRQDEYQQALEPRQARVATTAKKDDPAALKIADTIAQKFGVPWQEAWNISQRSKSDPREVALELYRKRRADVETNMVDETPDQTWDFVRSAMRGAGFESKEPAKPKATSRTKESIRDDYRSGKITREEAVKQIKALSEK